MAQRKILLRHVRDGGTRHMLDDGCDTEGRPNQMRQHLIRMLDKSLVVDGEPVNVFKLAAAPPSMPYDPADKKEQQARARDDFDRRYLMVDNKWRLASPEWEAASKKLREAKEAYEAEVEANVTKRKQQELGELLTEMVQQRQPKVKNAKPSAAD